LSQSFHHNPQPAREKWLLAIRAKPLVCDGNEDEISVCIQHENNLNEDKILVCALEIKDILESLFAC
jgi:hypothetical protein